ncbi:MAG: type I DNA topoisomerase [Planctomycetes bacterium]|nr:type I DNA topoisomerase [Planctomycetota bacterium]
MVSANEKALVIVESPTKARTISNFLPKGFKVEASIGHIRDLPTSAKEIPAAVKKEPWARLGINVESEFEPIYVIPAEKKKQVQRLKKLLEDVDVVYLATDEDREGESISWHLLEVLKPQVPKKRLVFHEITKTAIQEALENPRELDERMVKAQETRRILDRLYGYEISPILWRKVAPKLSAGRVQSVTVRLIVERERERQRFVKSTFWDLSADFKAATGAPFTTVLHTLDGKRVARGKDFDSTTGELRASDDVVLVDEAMAATLFDELQRSDWSVERVESKPYTDRPAPPFTTSTLQQEANRKLRLSARATMQAAQRLYESGLITYMRTDSTTLSEQAIQASREQIERLYGKEFLPAEPRIYRTKVKNAQEAHEAIRPASDFKRPEDLRGQLGDRELKLYELIWKRTMACQMKDAQGHRMTLRITDGRAVFQASGKTIDFPGYLRAYVEGADDPDAELADKELVLPSVKEGDPMTLAKLEPKSHTTQPPARYTEASLVKELEARGVGRPSTYATIIDTILHRQYVVKQGSALVPTFVAFAVVKLMEQYFADLVDIAFTARMEDDLDRIALGEMDALPYLRAFYFGDGSDAGLRGLIQSDIDARDVCTLPLGKDEEGRDVNVRVGRYGPYLERGDERATVPEGVAPDELDLARAAEILARGTGPIELGVDEETGRRVYVKTGRYGPYVQLGENDDEPKMKSLLPGMEMETTSLDEALRLLRLPRTIGEDAEGQPVLADYGRYGPYVKRGIDARSLERPEQIFEITLEEALAKLAEAPTRGRRRSSQMVRELGVDPTSEQPVRVMNGPYGLYVSDGSINASLPKNAEPEKVTLEEALELIRAREASGKVRRKKKAARKKAAKKAAKKVTKKKTAKKAAKKSTE